jgi:hypothetical protein
LSRNFESRFLYKYAFTAEAGFYLLQGRGMSKSAVLLLIGVLALSSLVMVGSVFAQSTSKPAVPEFTLQLVDDFVQVTIQNQPIIPNGDDTANIFYNIRIKDHDATDWISDTVPDPSKGIRGYIGEIGTSGSTTLLKSFNAIHDLTGRYDSFQVDYQIEAINGYLNSSSLYGPLPMGVDPNSRPTIIVNTSGWSNAQTITIPENQTPTPSPPATTPTPEPTPTPASTSTPPPTQEPTENKQFEAILGAAIVIAVLSAGLGLLVCLIKRK